MECNTKNCPLELPPISICYWFGSDGKCNYPKAKEDKMEYTKGERKVVLNPQKSRFEVRLYKNNDMMGTLASFTNEGDAILDAQAPRLYEACKGLWAVFGDDKLLDDIELRKEVLSRARVKGTEPMVITRIKALRNAREAIAKVEAGQ